MSFISCLATRLVVCNHCRDLQLFDFFSRAKHERVERERERERERDRDRDRDRDRETDRQRERERERERESLKVGSQQP